ncbi:MAG: hypothetical protein JWM96_948, partial [Alphaproteobacteria bacterium]|nr:hypothetical protein [Alphaproteobacteria bacterium]
DGPTHAANAALIVDLLTGRCPQAKAFFEFNPALVPNWSGHAAMAVGIFFHASLDQAEKIACSLCFLLPAIGLRQIGALYQKHDFRAWAGLAIGINSSFVYGGSYNFMIGIGLFLIAVAYYFKKRSHSKAWHFTVVFSLLLLGCWFSHILAFLFTGLVVFIHETQLLLQKKHFSLGDIPSIVVSWTKENWPLWCAFLPAVSLSLVYFLHPFKEYPMAFARGDLLGNLGTLFFMKDFFQVPANDINLMGLYGLISLTAWVFITKKIFSKSWDMIFFTLLLAGGILWLIPFIAPFSIKGGWFLIPRFNMAGWYLVIAASLRYSWGKNARDIFVLFCIAVFLGNLQAFALKRENSTGFAQTSLAGVKLRNNTVIYNMDLVGLDHPNSAATPLFAPDTGVAILPAGNILADRSSCILNLNNYEAMLDSFPLRFKLDRYPGPVWGVPYYNPDDRHYYPGFLELGKFDPKGFKQATGLPLDYLVVEGSGQMLANTTQPGATLKKNYYSIHGPVFDSQLQEPGKMGYREIYRHVLDEKSSLRIFESDTNAP